MPTLPFNMSLKDRAFGNAKTLQKMIHTADDLNAIRDKLILFIDSIVSFEPVLSEIPEHNAEHNPPSDSEGRR